MDILRHYLRTLAAETRVKHCRYNWKVEECHSLLTTKATLMVLRAIQTPANATMPQHHTTIQIDRLTIRQSKQTIMHVYSLHVADSSSLETRIALGETSDGVLVSGPRFATTSISTEVTDGANDL